MLDHSKIIKWLGCLILLCILSSTTAFSECSTCNNANSATAADAIQQRIGEKPVTIEEKTQEIQSQYENEDENQTSVLVNNNVSVNQTANLMYDGETKNFILTDEMIKGLFVPQQPDEGLGYKENAEDLRIAVDVIVKADNQVKLKYSECDIKTLSINLGSSGYHCGGIKSYPVYEDHDGAHVLEYSIKNAESCKFTYTLTRDGDLPTEPSLGYVNSKFKNLRVITKLYGYNSLERCPLEKRHHYHDRGRECCGSHQDDGYDYVAEEDDDYDYVAEEEEDA